MLKKITKQRAKQHKTRGFTLIEVLVSTALLVLLLMTATTMFMTFLVSNAKTSVRHTVKGEGSFALAKMEHLIKNAESVTVSCNQFAGGTNTAISLKNFDDPDIYLLSLTTNAGGTDQITYQNQTSASSEYLTSTNTSVSNLQFLCFGTNEKSRRIEISFDLAKTVNSVQATTDSITESFRSVVQIRN